MRHNCNQLHAGCCRIGKVWLTWLGIQALALHSWWLWRSIGLEPQLGVDSMVAVPPELNLLAVLCEQAGHKGQVRFTRHTHCQPTLPAAVHHGHIQMHHATSSSEFADKTAEADAGPQFVCCKP